jgi:hypothetical protein
VIGRVRGANYRGILVDLERDGEMEFVGWTHDLVIRVNPSEAILAQWTQEAETRIAERAEARIISRETDQASLKITKAQARILEKEAPKEAKG